MNAISGESALLVRDANLSDATQLAHLMCELGYQTSPVEMEQRLESILPDSKYRTLVAEIDGAVCAMIGTIAYPSYEHNDPSGHIIALVVSKEMRGRGIGRRLVALAEQEFGGGGTSRLAVNTRLTRKEAHKFYRALGFKRNGYRFVKTLV